MMSDNSKTMTLEERLVQHIKGTGLSALIEDEDAITELTRRAVQQALFQERTVPDGNWHTKRIDSPVVAASRELAAAAISKIVDEEIERIKSDPALIGAVREAIGLLLPEIVKNKISMLYDDIATKSSMQALQMLRDMGLSR